MFRKDDLGGTLIQYIYIRKNYIYLLFYKFWLCVHNFTPLLSLSFPFFFFSFFLLRIFYKIFKFSFFKMFFLISFFLMHFFFLSFTKIYKNIEIITRTLYYLFTYIHACIVIHPYSISPLSLLKFLYIRFDSFASLFPWLNVFSLVF